MLELIAAAGLAAETLSRLPAAEAHQGVAVGSRYVYAVGNSEIGKYERKTGARVALWKGDPETFPHLNSCTLVRRELVCASSNYPAVPMASSVEIFDRRKMVHRRSIPLGRQPGSLTWVQRRRGSWWACFANYDGRGGEPGRDHRSTVLVRFDDRWRARQMWRFPGEVLARFRPRSSSGGAFGRDGRLYVTGHDLPEVYVMEVPKHGAVLRHVATISVAFEGQAVAFDKRADHVLFGISRARREVVAMKLPRVEGK